MSRRDSSPKVTLFPFLAVLVCTMGALILLLVVTTRMIRRQTLAELEKSFTSPPAVEVIPEAAPAEPELILSDAGHEMGLQPVEDPVLESPTATVVKPEAVAPPPPFPDRLAWELERDEILRKQAEADQKARSEWESKVSALRDQRKKLLSQLDQKAASITRVKTDSEKVREQVARYEQVIQESTQQQASISEQLEKMATLADEVTSRMQLLEGEILQLEQAPPPRPEYQFVAFDALTGTTRRPILIECTADSAIFASEKVTVTAEQLSGFTPDYNPLLAGARALTAYWTQQDGPQAPRPYVLLVVRAEGTVGFYVARKMLEQLGEPFGYELVEDEKPIHWPEPDAGATEVCRKAVEQVLADRSHLQQRQALRNGVLSRDKQFAGSDGNFWLPEVDQLSEPDEQVTFGGRSFSRKATTGGAGSPPRQELSPMQQRLLGKSPGEGSGVIADIPATPPVPGNQPGSGPRETAGDTKGTATPDSDQVGLDPEFLNQLIAATERARASQASSNQSGVLEESGQTPAPGSPAKQSLRDAVKGGQQLPELPNSLLPHVSGAGGSGVAVRSGTIGLERQIVLDISPKKIVIDDQIGLDITESLTTSQLQQLVAKAIDLQIRGWGPSPGGFYWKPYLKVIVHPGGNANLGRLTELFKHWKLQWTVDHRLD